MAQDIINGYVKSISYKNVKGTFEGKEYDIDRYNIETKTALATHEYSVGINHVDKSLFGDVVQYGGCHDLEQKEIVALLELVKSEGKLKRSYIQ